ncbi:response regulator [Natranaerobius thermophilus]|uniref:Stage 0 sporulation protein A homolog n=1 Tax=Natranaerobius thermophilus (strain ATCC BAA-1301 / DSM 18059 / JW/NM-WN-LF) TaxID=457570 RepID=B2A4S9_NATTJ|nr:response regulator [Natranaerobius thermophilus]ACB83851.1 response regulator receiver protein [Natranaerobius thermophilus JW/NM-WN-LF]
MNKKLLIVDDEKNIRMTLKNCLSYEGYELEIALNGEEALEKLRTQDYDLVLLDLKLPGLNGLQVLEKVRDEGRDVKVIMMTAYGTVERAVNAMKLGAIDFINKPFSPNQIRALVNDVLSRPNLSEENLQTYKDHVEFAKKCIIESNYTEAEKHLTKALEKDYDKPEPNNLLGVLAEYNGELGKARKHYRAALALDPSYKPANTNLERVTRFKYTKDGITFGNEEEKGEEEQGEDKNEEQ